MREYSFADDYSLWSGIVLLRHAFGPTKRDAKALLGGVGRGADVVVGLRCGPGIRNDDDNADANNDEGECCCLEGRC